MYRHFFKRLFDFCISLVALICISPILLVVTVWLHFANKGAGAFYHSTRIGYRNREFHIYKYKSMTDERDAEGNLLPDEQRLTKVGRFIRSTSIDELPQFFNVLKGDMALIGPRPLPAWHQRMGTGTWKEQHYMGRQVQARCVVCRPSERMGRPENHLSDSLQGHQEG